MKRFITSIAMMLAVFSVTSTYAQQGGGGQQMDPAARKEAMKQRLKTELSMTDAQADSIASIQQEFRPQMRTIFMNQDLSQDEKMAKIGELNAQQDKRIQPILGDDLFKKYKDWQEKNRQQRGGGRGGNQ